MRYKTFFRRYYNVIPLLVMLTLVTYFLHRYVESKYEDFVETQTQLAQQSINSAGALIEQFLKENERRVDLFGQDAKANIQRAIDHSTDDDTLIALLNAKARRHFPNYFALSIADKDGTVLLEDFDSLVGDICQNDIYHFAHLESGGSRPIYIHPNSEGYHFDIMSRWDDPATQESGIFFLSFSTEIIEDILGQSHLLGHKLILIHRDINHLIEITAEGTRDDLFKERGEKMRLDEDEADRILGSPRAIEGTLWLLTNLHDAGLFSKYRKKLYREAGIIALFFLMVGGVMYLLVRREEKRKRIAQNALRQMNEQLEDRVSRRTADLSILNTALSKANSALSKANKELKALNLTSAQVNKRLDKEVRSRRRMAEALESQALVLRHQKENLAKAKMEAEEANVAKSRILSAASHDLRQPLHTLDLLTAGLSKESNDPNKLKKALKCVRETLSDMERLLETLLNMGKLEANALTPEIKSFPVQKLLDSSQRTFEAHALESGLVLKVRSSRYVIKSDPVLLERIIHNFIGNAIRYTEQGKILLACRRRGDALRIEVWDTGPGIPKDMQRKIFDAYVQLESGSQSRIRGSGLGLSITQRMAALMEHPINVCSRMGQGSVFYVTVPLVFNAKVERDITPALFDENIKAVQPKPSKSSSVRLLLIDDDEFILDSSCFLLEANGYAIFTAQNAKSAQAQLATALPDLIICDYHLGSIKGPALVRQLRKQAGKHLPAILLSGDILPHSDDYHVLQKPVSEDVLCKTIEQLLSR